MSITSQLNKWLRITGKVTYYRKNSDNMPHVGLQRRIAALHP